MELMLARHWVEELIIAHRLAEQFQLNPISEEENNNLGCFQLSLGHKYQLQFP